MECLLGGLHARGVRTTSRILNEFATGCQPRRWSQFCNGIGDDFRTILLSLPIVPAIALLATVSPRVINVSSARAWRSSTRCTESETKAQKQKQQRCYMTLQTLPEFDPMCTSYCRSANVLALHTLFVPEVQDLTLYIYIYIYIYIYMSGLIYWITSF